MSETPKVIACYEESVAMKCAEQGCQCFQLERDLNTERTIFAQQLKQALADVAAERARSERLDEAGCLALERVQQLELRVEQERAKREEGERNLGQQILAWRTAAQPYDSPSALSASLDERDLLRAEVAGLREAGQALLAAIDNSNMQVYIAEEEVVRAALSTEEKC